MRITTLLLLLCIACRQKPAPGDTLLQLRELSELATVEYTISKIVKASDDQTWYKVGDRKILMSCRAQVKAGINLSAVQEGDIRATEKEITLILPRAEILSVNIRPEDLRTEFEEVGLFRSEFTAGEKNLLMAQGESQIRKQVEATNIIQTAESQATIVLSNFFRSLGYEKVQIQFDQNKKPAMGPAL